MIGALHGGGWLAAFFFIFFFLLSVLALAHSLCLVSTNLCISLFHPRKRQEETLQAKSQTQASTNCQPRFSKLAWRMCSLKIHVQHVNLDVDKRKIRTLSAGDFLLASQSHHFWQHWNYSLVQHDSHRRTLPSLGTSDDALNCFLNYLVSAQLKDVYIYPIITIYSFELVWYLWPVLHSLAATRVSRLQRSHNCRKWSGL